MAAAYGTGVPAVTYLLLPPSEGKAEGGTRARGRGPFDARLRVPRRAVATALAAACSSDRRTREKVFGARGDLLTRAEAAARALGDGTAPRLPAWQRHTGVVWTHLAPADLEPSDRARILVPDAVHGLTTAEDRIADFRCKLSVNLAPLGVLAPWWRPFVTDALVDHCHGATVVDLLPAEHAAAVDWPTLAGAATVVRVDFVGPTGRAVGHDAKAVKGAFARHLLVHGLPAATRFRTPGWRVTRARTGDLTLTTS